MVILPCEAGEGTSEAGGGGDLRTWSSDSVDQHRIPVTNDGTEAYSQALILITFATITI